MFFPFWFDPTFILLIPAILLAAWAQIQVSSTFSKYSRYRSSLGMTGAQVARMLLDSTGLYNVEIEMISGSLTDHYDPRAKVIRLSKTTYSSQSVAAIGVIAHEIGHAIQHKENYVPLILRNAVVPVASIGSSLSWIIFIIGLLFFNPALIRFGIILFSLAVLFTIITLPVELNASKRALKLLRNNLLLPEQEVTAAKKVLNAAALTYVASMAMALLQLLRMIFIAGMFGGDRS
ncbi:MAG TPA: zinc metallopeptidase [Thermotogaceae bacterium]|nr:zinc metallopeptidase [Thermotogota bacterium]HEW90955.1 zinc metallopeptidase [Thermotogaceae bacterium]